MSTRLAAKPQQNSLYVTVLTSARDQGKLLFLDDDGMLDSEHLPSPKTSTFEVRHFDDFDDFVDSCVLSDDFDPRDALVFGLPEKDSGKIVLKGRERNGAISRSRDCFEFPADSGIMLLDIDGPEGELLAADEIDRRMIDAAPWLIPVRRIYIPSSSGCIYQTRDDGVRRDDDPCVSVKVAYRCYLAVDDASQIPGIGRALFKALVEKGQGFIKLASNGRRLLRTLIDDAVWTPEHLDYAFGPTFDDDRLYQHIDDDILRCGGDKPMLQADAVPMLTEEQYAAWRSGSSAIARLMDEAAGESEQRRQAWIEARVAAEGEHMRPTYSRAAGDAGELPSDFVLYLDNGEPITVAEVLDDPDKYERAAIRDPIEPDVRGKAKLFLKGQYGFPTAYSFRHGGMAYRLLGEDDEFDMTEIGKTLAAGFARIGRPLPVANDNAPADIGELPQSFLDKLDDRKESPESLVKWMVKRGYGRDDVLATVKDAACAARLSDDDLQGIYLRQERRQAQIRDAEQSGVPDRPVTAIVTLKEMHRDFVYLRNDQLVASRRTGVVLPRAAIRADLAASIMRVGRKDALTFDVWMRDAERITADAPTWVPGEGDFCTIPGGIIGLGGTLGFNMWRGLPAYTPPADWRDRIEPFIGHIDFLVPIEKERERFVQWLAHALQKPGEIPHTYYCLIARKHGVGRNWLSILLGRMLPGLVAQSIDIGYLLEKNFNGILSKKLFLVVDEAHEAMEGGHKYANAKKLRRMVTEDERLINPKTFAQYVEKNCGRWLMFSNYEDPLPVDDEDRRGIFIQNPDEVRSEGYYSKVYGLLNDRAFIASVRHYLQTLDISTFNPGERAPLNEMKRRVVDAGKSELDRAVDEFAREYPGWFVTNDEIRKFVLDRIGDDAGFSDTAFRHALRRYGVTSAEHAIKIRGKVQRLSIVKGRMETGDLKEWNTERIADWIEQWLRWMRSDPKKRADAPMPS
jgi:hypothetical protein